MMSTEIFALKMGAAPDVALALEQAVVKFGISTVLQKAHFFAQMSVESAGFTTFTESLNYSEQRIREVAAKSPVGSRWRSLGPRAKQLARNPRALGNAAYGGRMGNGPEVSSDDGFEFRGRGAKQLTGRSNYTLYSLETYGDLRCVTSPGLLALMPDAIISAAWFWTKNNCGPIADRDDIVTLTRVVNGGENGLAARRAAFAKAMQLLQP